MINYNFIFNLETGKVCKKDPCPSYSIKYYNTKNGKMVEIGDGYRHEIIINGKYWNRILKIIKEEMPLEKALRSGAQAEFGHKYPAIVSVYTILDNSVKNGWFSKEICTGPHVKNTREIGNFRIIKEEASSAGVRRIKAIIE